MMNELVYDETFKPVIQLVFGKTLVCRNLEVASQYAKSENLDCISLEGTETTVRLAAPLLSPQSFDTALSSQKC